jgi:hypothetical protein
MKIPLILLAVLASAAAWGAMALRPGAYSTTVEVHLPGASAPETITKEDCITRAESKDMANLLVRELAAIGLCKVASNVKSEDSHLSFEMQCDVDGAQVDARSEMTFGKDWLRGSTTLLLGRDVITSKMSAKWVRATCSAATD